MASPEPSPAMTPSIDHGIMHAMRQLTLLTLDGASLPSGSEDATVQGCSIACRDSFSFTIVDVVLVGANKSTKLHFAHVDIGILIRHEQSKATARGDCRGWRDWTFHLLLSCQELWNPHNSRRSDRYSGARCFWQSRRLSRRGLE